MNSLFNKARQCLPHRLIPGVSLICALVVLASELGNAQAPRNNDRSSRRDARDTRDARRSAASSSAGRASSPSGTNTVAQGELGDFSVIADRNIFNPNRGPRNSRSATAAEAPPKPVVVETATLVGTLLHAGAQMAFFDSSTASLKKAMRFDESLGGLRLREIGKDFVVLSTGTNDLRVGIGAQLKRQDDGPWSVTASTLSMASSKQSGSGASSSADSSGEEDEIVKRLMKKREKENN